MYTIFIALACLYFIRETFLHNPLFRRTLNQMICFFDFVSKHNPLLLTYYDEDVKSNEENHPQEQNAVVSRYEDKYLEKFKSFPSDYVFNEKELEEENRLCESLKGKYETNKKDNLSRISSHLAKLNALCEKLGHGKDTPENKQILLEFNDYTKDGDENDKEYEDFVNSIHFDEMYQDVIEQKKLLEEELREITEKNVTEEEFHLEARNKIINNKLDGYINNYVLEHTPLGNIYMRYNNKKKSFEYFSNNTIPYRYLETVGRKYVMTYWCKPLFVDTELELKQAEQRYDEEHKRRKEEELRVKEEIAKNPRNVLARMKNYNKETKSQVTMSQPMKNRTQNNVLPPQIKANLVQLNQSQSSEKQLLKEHSNRYTWEGRLSGFCPLQKVNKKTFDKKLAMTYADYKLWQKTLQEKKDNCKCK